VNQFGSGYRPLHLVNSTTNTSKIIRTLCEHEVNVEAPNKFRGTPLRMAIQWRWLENIKELLRCGASLEEASDGWKQDTQWGKTEQNKFNESLKTANVQQAIKDGNELFYINECKSSPCKNGGTCTTSDGSYLCSCQDGWTGNNCNQDINECNSGPCKNGGTCANSDGSYSCRCRRGWMGKNCNWDLNECNLAVDICWNGGTCTNSQGSFSCKCTKFWEGSNCQKKKTKIQCPRKYSKYDCNESVGRRYGCIHLKCWRSDGNSWCYSKGSGLDGYDWCNLGDHAGCKAAAEIPCRHEGLQ